MRSGLVDQTIAEIACKGPPELGKRESKTKREKRELKGVANFLVNFRALGRIIAAREKKERPDYVVRR